MTYSSRVFWRSLSIFVLCALIPNLSTAQIRGMKISDVDQRIQRMSVDEKVGQLFILGFPHRQVTHDLQKFLTTYKPGSFVIFKRNFNSLTEAKKLTTDLTALTMKNTGLVPFLAIDQEGGNVSRIPTNPPMPNALSLGQADSPQIAEDLGYETAALMKQLGFNMNLAPVLDVADPLQFSFIGARSYGSDPRLVGDMGFYFSKGLIRNGVVPTAKHFPGTGSTTIDPHYNSSISAFSEKELNEKHLPPFQTYSKLGIFSAVMVSHSVYPSLDESGKPAVFSKKIVNDLLRDKMKFRGLVITDDLQMSASKNLLQPAEAALIALQSGSDIVMFTWSFREQEKAMQRIKKAILSGEISAQDLQSKLRRILTAKSLLASSISVREPQSVLSKNALVSPSMQKIDDEILQKNVSETQPRSLQNEKICVFSSSASFIRSFRSQFKAFAKIVLIKERTSSLEIEKTFKKSNCQRILFTVNGAKTAKILARLSVATKKKTLVANLATPNLVREPASYDQVLNLYFPHQNAGKKIAQLLGESYAIREP